MSSGWAIAGVIIAASAVIVAAVAGIVLPAFRDAKLDRKTMMESIGAVGKLIASQNSRVTKLEVRVDDHDRRLDRVEGN